MKNPKQINMLNIILFGPPGAGKGTQSEKIIDKYKLKHLSTGDILREAIKNKTTVGLEAKKYIDNGELVPDEVVINLISIELDNHNDAKGFIFDGFPRTTLQAEKLDDMLTSKGQSITVMMALDVEHNELIKRLLNRGQISGRTDDSNQEVIENRINVYDQCTKIVAEYYKTQGKFRLINGMGSIDEIFQRICNTIDNYK